MEEHERKRLGDAAYVVCTEVLLAKQRAADSFDDAERWHRDMLAERLEKIKAHEEETTTRKFYRWVFGTLLLTGVVWRGLLL